MLDITWVPVHAPIAAMATLILISVGTEPINLGNVSWSDRSSLTAIYLIPVDEGNARNRILLVVIVVGIFISALD